MVRVTNENCVRDDLKLLLALGFSDGFIGEFICIER